MNEDYGDLTTWKIELLSQAHEDISELLEYYERVYGAKAADRLDVALAEGISTLDFFPRINRTYNGQDEVRVLSLRTHRISVVYQIDDVLRRVIVTYVFSSSQDPKLTEHNLRYR